MTAQELGAQTLLPGTASYPALTTVIGIVAVTAVLLVASRYFDASGGLLTISLVLLLAFTLVALASLFFVFRESPTGEMLVGALATAFGTMISLWVSKGRHDGKE